MEPTSVVITVDVIDPNEDLKGFVIDKAELVMNHDAFKMVWRIRCDPVTASLILLKCPR